MTLSIDIILEAEQLEGTQAVVSNWLIKLGDKVLKDQPIVELETDKVAIEVCATHTGFLESIQVNVGDKVGAGHLLATMVSEQNTTNDTTPLESLESLEVDSVGIHTISVSDKAQHLDSQQSKRHILGPAVKKLLTQHTIDPNTLTGSGLDGRITKRDVQQVIAQISVPVPIPTPTLTPISKESLNTGSAFNDDDQPNSLFVPHTPMRSAIAKHMCESLLETSPHVTSVFEMDMSAIIAHRATRKLGYLDAQVQLTFSAYFLAASALAIKEVPEINSQYHADGLEIFKHVNIGVGTALEDNGLVVPVVNNVQDKSLFQLANDLTQQTQRARSRKLTAKEMLGGTFTISNYGVSGSLLATPIIINQPQVAILGVGKMQKRVLVESIAGEDSMVIKPMCYVSLSIDHRALDAFQTNKFLAKFVQVIEQWES